MSQESKIDVLPREETVVVVDESGDSFELGRTDEGVVVEEAPEHVRDAVENDERLTVLEDTYDFPLSFSYGHHLEDGVLYQLSVELQETLESVFGSQPSLPSMEIHSHWSFDEDGNAELEYVEYDGTKYTPDE